MRALRAWLVASVVLYVLAVVASSSLAVAQYGGGIGFGDRAALAAGDLLELWAYALILAGVFGIALLLAAAISRLTGLAGFPLFLLAGTGAAAGLPAAGWWALGAPPLLATDSAAGLAAQAGAGVVAGLIFAAMRGRRARGR